LFDCPLGQMLNGLATARWKGLHVNAVFKEQLNQTAVRVLPV
jgi:hypothetical protein